MSSEFYRIVHVTGVVMILSGLAGLWGVYSTGTPKVMNRIGLALVHGLGMALVLVSGFGRLAQLGYLQSLPVWVYVKLTLWLLLGGSMVWAKRRAAWGLPLLVLWIAIAATGAYLGIVKPGG